MDGLLHDMRRYWAVNHYTVHLKLKQHGGSNEGDGTIYVNKHPITYREEIEGNAIFIFGGDVNDWTPCFVLEFTAGSTVATLNTVERRTKCFADGHTDSRDIVRAAYIIARDRGITSIDLKDVSYIYCPKEVSLSNLSFLTTGRTWYESIFPEITVVNYPNLLEWRRRVQTTTWRQVGSDLLPSVEITGIDIDEPGSAMAVMAAMKHSRDFCRFFNRHMDTLLQRSGITSLNGISWRIPVRPRRTSPSRNSMTRRRTRRLTNRSVPTLRLKTSTDNPPPE